jgi:hypothetical protein
VLTINVLGEEYFDDDKQEFVYPESFELQLEHSLASLSKWEEEYEKPFLDQKEKTTEEAFYYIYCMILTPGYDRDVVHKLSEENVQAIQEYIQKPMTATWFSGSQKKGRNTEMITAELIYWWVSQAGFPESYHRFHLNKLFTLLRIHGLKNQKPEKLSRREQFEKQRALNDKRRKELGTTG